MKPEVIGCALCNFAMPSHDGLIGQGITPQGGRFPPAGRHHWEAQQ